MIRTDRLLSIVLFSLYRKIAPLSNRHIPLLMYHGIAEKTESTGNPYFRVTTSPRVFEQHLKTLAEKSYAGCRLDAIADRLTIPGKKVVLTFDDGFEDFYSSAWPILEKYGFSASVFLPTGFIGAEDTCLIKGKRHLSWAQIRELNANGVEFGSHSITHPVLRNHPRDVIRREIVKSKTIIEDQLGNPVHSFSYPYAFPFDDHSLTLFLEDCVRSAGYKFAVSTRIGVHDSRKNCLFMPRLPMNDLDDTRLFLAKISGAYDWVNVVQYIYRYLNLKIGFKPKNKSKNVNKIN
jgi:peptidoglycan/xylan/chitin deacetylase (PgdA/CDA1 family)